MIEISPQAQAYFVKLLQQQDGDELGLRIQVLAPGTPRADCDLQFCPVDRRKDDDVLVEYDDFNLYVEGASVRWLDEAAIDFEEGPAGGQLTIKAPNIKGNQPAKDSPLNERIQWVLESEVNPRLAAHGGMVSLASITEDLGVVLRFGGGCQGCGMADVTLKEGIEKTLKEQFPEITSILDATEHEAGENPYYAPS
jgi:Fe/S biogenesis protein NfuA